MLCLAASVRQTSRLVAALPARSRPTTTTDWAELERAASAAACAVVWIEWLGEPEDFARLAAFRARFPLQPLVLVTQRDADNARHLKDVAVDEVVWQHEVAHALWPAVGRARAHGTLARCAAELERAAALPAALRRGLAYACASPSPVHTVSALADVLGCDRRTLWRHWHAGVCPRAPLSLQHVLDWLLLLRARARKSADASWRVVAAEVGVHEHTIARLTQRLVGHTLRELAEQPVDDLLDAFRASVLEPIARPPLAAGDATPETAWERVRRIAVANPDRAGT